MFVSDQAGWLDASTLRAAAEHGREVHGPEETAERAVLPEARPDPPGRGAQLQCQGNNH